MKNSKFKAAYNRYLISIWSNDSLSQLFQGKTLYASLSDTCYMYTVDGGVVSRREEPGLYNNHEEADSRMYYHVAFLTSQHTGSTTKGAILSSEQEQMMLTVSIFPLTA